MAATPTPEEAQQALQDVARRRDQTATAAGWPRWTWIVAGVLAAAYGVLADRVPEFVRTWGTPIIVLSLVIAQVVNTRWGSTLLRRPVRLRASSDPASTVWVTVAVLVVIGAAILAIVLDVPHAGLWGGLIGGVLLAVGGPWWQRRVLARGARR